MLSSAAAVSARCCLLVRPRPAAALAQRVLHHSALQQQQRANERSRPVQASSSAPSVEEPAAADSNSPGGSFAELGVDPRLAATLPRQGIDAPTEVQSGAIPLILQGDNVAIQCYTGSGKTLAYLLPVLTRAIERSKAEWEAATRKTRKEAGSIQAVVVAPSRELAMQIMRVAQSLLPESAKRAVQQAIGGANIWRQRDALKLHKPLLVVGTPGRLAELSRDGSLQTHKCGMLVLDEVDQLLAPQFREEMTRITEHCGKKAEGGRQTVIVSATLTPRVLLTCQPWCPNPAKVFVGVPQALPPPEPERQTRTPISSSSAPASGAAGTSGSEGEAGAGAGADGAAEAAAEAAAAGPRPQWGWGLPEAPSVDGNAYVSISGSAGGFGNSDRMPSMPPHLRHAFVSSAPQHKVDTLRRCIHALGSQRSLVFMNFQQRLRDTEGKLAARGMPVASLHGEQSKQQRKNTLEAFRRGDYRALIVSDVAARGLDIPEVDAVFHLELPTDAAHYAHRAGRTGRAGRPGLVVSLVSGGERFVVDKLASRLGVAFEEVEVTHGEAVVRPASAPGSASSSGSRRGDSESSSSSGSRSGSRASSGSDIES